MTEITGVTEIREYPPEQIDSLDELAAALAKFQAEMPTVAKRKTANTGSYSYKYADLADVTEAAMPILAKYGLSFVCLPSPAGLQGMLLHSSGQRLHAVLPITGSTPQQVGSSLTYMRRYLLGCLTGVVTDDDDDGRGAAQSQSRPQAAPATRSGGGLRSRVEEPSPPRDDRPPVAPSVADPNLMDPKSPIAKAMYAGIRDAGIPTENVHTFLSETVGREVTSSKELTVTEVRKVLDLLPQPSS